MIQTTPQERTALLAVALLLMSGVMARHAAYLNSQEERLEYSSERADTLNPGSDSPLRREVVEQIERQEVRDRPLGPGELIDPNTASPDQLARLPRIGPGIAERIAAFRETGGSFRTADDLLAVPGIGPSLLEAILPHVKLRGGPSRGTRNSISGNQIDINRATAEELETLRGIGPAIARRVVEYREEHGSFRAFEDLENVSGIGPSLRGRLEAAARLGP